MSRRHARRLSACAALIFAAACGKGDPHGKAAPQSSGSAAEAEVLPSRPEVVAAADVLAVEGSKEPGEAGARLTRRAADLRRRLWRLERREADALEAIELLRALARPGWEGACDASLDRALLEAELRNDPAFAYRSIYLARASAPRSACAERAARVLSTLAAFKPLPSVLAELDREVSDKRGGSAAPDAGQTRVATVRLDPSGQVVVPTLSGGPQGPARITNIERYGARDAARIVVFVTRPALFDVGFIAAEGAERGPRLFVDIEQASYKGALSFDVGGIVKRVRVGHQKRGSRIVLDLESSVYRRVFYLPEPFRLVIDVSKEPPPSSEEPARAGPRTVRRIVLDPGHGGHDPGATGPSGLREKDVTLDVAHRAAPLIARELGIVTLLTRDGDEFVALDERTARANAFQADLFISLHCNASEDGGGRGIMTFVLDESRDAIASRIAARENAASPAAAAELATAMSGMLDAGSRARSLEFAELLQRATVASITPSYPGVVDQGVKRAGFYVLAGARMPAVLFETSFISNSEGESKLNTGDYRQKIADSIVNAVRAYRERR
jgi:N-acetylmuramoyl-L-alanine amidase